MALQVRARRSNEKNFQANGLENKSENLETLLACSVSKDENKRTWFLDIGVKLKNQSKPWIQVKVLGFSSCGRPKLRAHI